MTRDNKYGSLHGAKLQANKEARLSSPEDLNAPPEDDSIDEASLVEGSPRQKSSEAESRRGPSPLRTPWKKEGTIPTKEKEEEITHQDGLPPSNIRGTTFISQGSRGSQYGSQSSQKRKREQLMEADDDDFGMAWSQQSCKKAFVKNIFKAPTKDQKKPEKVFDQERKEGKPIFKRTKVELPQAQGTQPRFNDKTFLMPYS